MKPKWIPFHPHEVICLLGEEHDTAPESHCPFFNAHIISENRKQTTEVSHPRRGNLTQVWLLLVSEILSVSIQALCATSTFLCPSPTLSSWCGLCALSDVTTDTRQSHLVARYYSLTFLHSFQLYLSSSCLAHLMPCKVLGAQSAKWSLGKDRLVSVCLNWNGAGRAWGVCQSSIDFRCTKCVSLAYLMTSV